MASVAQLAALQQSSVTYTMDPSDKDSFQVFCNEFDVESRTSEISQMLKANEAIEAMHKNLVPVCPPRHPFWGAQSVGLCIVA